MSDNEKPEPNPESYDEGWVDPVETRRPWTLIDAVLEVQRYAYRRAAAQLEEMRYQDAEDFQALVTKHTRDMLNLAESILKAEYPHFDFDQFWGELQEFAIYGEEEEEEPEAIEDAYEATEYEEYEEATEENGWELISDDEASSAECVDADAPSSEELNQWWNL